MEKPCFECGSVFTSDGPRCPACAGVREWRRQRYINLYGNQYGDEFSESAFQAVFGPNDPIDLIGAPCPQK